MCARPFGWLPVPACKGAIRQMNCGLALTYAPNSDSSAPPQLVHIIIVQKWIGCDLEREG